jgi:hypothetical protein
MEMAFLFGAIQGNDTDTALLCKRFNGPKLHSDPPFEKLTVEM